MGTRHLIAVQKDNEYKVAQYGQWDGCPSGQGVDVLNFLKNTDLTKFSIILDFVKFYTEDELQKIYDEHTDNGSIIYGSEHQQYWKDNLEHISRNTGAKILSMIMQNGVRKIKNSITFAGDSLFCEYAYVIDLDNKVFEVYEGFNKDTITEGRFVSGDKTLDSSNGYEPVKLIKSYSLSDLPCEKQFLEDLESEE